MVISFKKIHRFGLIISCIVFALQSYGMEREIIQKDFACDNASTLLVIVAQQDFSFFDSFCSLQSVNFVSNLSLVNKQCNKACNCPIFTKKFMRYFFDKYIGGARGFSEANFITSLRTDGARQYKELSEKLLTLRSCNSNMDDIKTLITDGADVCYRKPEKVRFGWIECPVLCPLSNAVAQNLTDVVALLFEHGATVNSFGATLLNMAIAHGNPEMVTMLLNNGVVIDNPKDGISSVSRAVRRGNNIILKIFFDRGIHFNNLVSDSFEVQYPLYIAACEAQWESVKFLLECGAVEGAYRAFDHARSVRGDLCAKKFLCRWFTREEAVAEVYRIDAVMKALLLKKAVILTDRHVQKALGDEDKNLLRLYCECDAKIASQILAIYPDVLESRYT